MHKIGNVIMAAIKPQMEVTKILRKVSKDLDLLNEKVNAILEMQKKLSTQIMGQKIEEEKPLPEALDVMTLLSLPDHLRKTAIAVSRSGKATANDVAKETKRARAVESNYLNQLVMMGHLKRERKGRKVLFFIER
jgi:hypothetical protein